VRGEISNLKLQSSGHLYFNLKDEGAVLSAALFRGSAAHLPRMPKEGDQVIAKGEITVYAPRGGYQIVVRELQFQGAGELLLKLHQLKETLQARGWFDPARKKALPKLPKRIGVVTSPTGAVIQDILNVLTRRFAGFSALLYPVKVQGDGAAQEIAKAIYDMNRYRLADVLIVGRGGGSIEDLWAFNEEIVAKAIFDSEIPVISAVGHETDVTIADWAADVRAPTPSAAAEMAIAEKANLLQGLQRVSLACKQFLAQKIRERKTGLGALARHPLFSQPHSLLAERWMRLDHLANALEDRRPSRQIAEQRERLAERLRRLDETMRAKLALNRSRFSTQALLAGLDRSMQSLLTRRQDLLRRETASMQALHPDNLLKKGYAILFSEMDDSIILSAKQLTPKQTFTARFADGNVRAEALEIFHGSNV
jgi:exodeoxyribonuclease VII large subunit